MQRGEAPAHRVEGDEIPAQKPKHLCPWIQRLIDIKDPRAETRWDHKWRHDPILFFHMFLQQLGLWQDRLIKMWSGLNNLQGSWLHWQQAKQQVAPSSPLGSEVFFSWGLRSSPSTAHSANIQAACSQVCMQAASHVTCLSVPHTVLTTSPAHIPWPAWIPACRCLPCSTAVPKIIS